MRTVLIAAGVALACTGTAVAQDKPWLEVTPALGKISAQPKGVLSKDALQELVDVGGELFEARFTTLGGAGRPRATQAIIPTKSGNRTVAGFARTSGPDSNGCASCHNDPVTGGAGDFVTNVFVSEGFSQFDFDSTDPQFSNERGTNHLFGAGLIELLAREMTQDLQALRAGAVRTARQSGHDARVALETKGVNFGWIAATPQGFVLLDELDGIDTDLVIRPFSQKGVMTSLRQFTINAMNHHHGMQAQERFGSRWTDEPDFDEDGHADEMSEGDIAALVAWQATLPTPVRDTRDNAEWQKAAEAGGKLFEDIGCGGCHMQALPLRSLAFADPGPFDSAGTLNDRQVADAAVYDLALLDWAKGLPRNDKGEVLVPLFGDLKRHNMTDGEVDAFGNELLSQRFVDRTIFATAELWGVGSTAPYGHRNDMTTLDEVIRAHGGAGREARDAYVSANAEAQSQIIAFLKSLVLEQ
jgi:cytochrome c peroxidase